MRSSRANRRVGRPKPSATKRALLIGSVAVAAVAIVIAIVVLATPRGTAQAAWARLGTEDVHALAFVGEDPNAVLFGHHAGLLSSSDGGRTWSAVAVREDAMSTSAASDGSIVIAGHEVLVASRDNGSTWAPIRSDLPNLDIHGLTRDPDDPARMWAYLATGGLWESTDYGTHWTMVQEENIAFPVALRTPGLRLMGVAASGLVASDDGGTTWTALTTPPAYPFTSLVATKDGGVLYAGSTDGLFRSRDAGVSWTRTPYEGSAFAIATTADGSTVAVVSRDTDYYRSDDGGQTWPGPR